MYRIKLLLLYKNQLQEMVTKIREYRKIVYFMSDYCDETFFPLLFSYIINLDLNSVALEASY